MAPADGGDDVAEKSSFRWIDAARYVVASVVAVLIIAVIVNAIKLVLRPDDFDWLEFLTIGTSVPMVRIRPSSKTLVLRLGLDAYNTSPSGRMYYVNITGYLFDQNVTAAAASLDPSRDCIVSFPVEDRAVAQLKSVVALVEITAPMKRNLDASYFDDKYVTMRLDGTLITEVRPWWKASSRRTSYYCWPLDDKQVFKNGVSSCFNEADKDRLIP